MMKRKKVKGVTLVEIIIAILVLSVTGLIMVRVGQLSSRIMLNTNHVNNKTNAEAPVARSRSVGLLKDDAGNYIQATDSNGNNITPEADVTITVGVCDPTDPSVMKTVYSEIDAKRYSTAGAAVSREQRATSEGSQYNVSGVDANIDFYVLVDPTEATT